MRRFQIRGWKENAGFRAALELLSLQDGSQRPRKSRRAATFRTLHSSFLLPPANWLHIAGYQVGAPVAFLANPRVVHPGPGPLALAMYSPAAQLPIPPRAMKQDDL